MDIILYKTTLHWETQYTTFELIYGKLAYMPNQKILNSKSAHKLDNYEQRKKKSEENSTNQLDINTGGLILMTTHNKSKLDSPHAASY